MNRRVRNPAVVSGIFAVFLVAGCSREIQPQEIHPEDLCEYCRMAISQFNFASEIAAPDGTAYKFDDVGCMIKYADEHSIPQGSIRFVRDFYTAEWVTVERAMFVKSSTVMTPMDFGVVAFSREENVKKFLSDYGGTQFPRDQLKAAIHVK